MAEGGGTSKTPKVMDALLDAFVAMTDVGKHMISGNPDAGRKRMDEHQLKQGIDNSKTIYQGPPGASDERFHNTQQDIVSTIMNRR